MNCISFIFRFTIKTLESRGNADFISPASDYEYLGCLRFGVANRLHTEKLLVITHHLSMLDQKTQGPSKYPFIYVYLLRFMRAFKKLRATGLPRNYKTFPFYNDE